MRGERVFAVPPLALPDPKHLPDSETLSRYGAVALFLERAQEVDPSFQLTPKNAPLIAEICLSCRRDSATSAVTDPMRARNMSHCVSHGSPCVPRNASAAERLASAVHHSISS